MFCIGPLSEQRTSVCLTNSTQKRLHLHKPMTQLCEGGKRGCRVACLKREDGERNIPHYSPWRERHCQLCLDNAQLLWTEGRFTEKELMSEKWCTHVTAWHWHSDFTQVPTEPRENASRCEWLPLQKWAERLLQMPAQAVRQKSNGPRQGAFQKEIHKKSSGLYAIFNSADTEYYIVKQ